MQTVLAERDFDQAPDRLFAYLSEHENLSELFGMRTERVRDGEQGERNGVGSVRRLSFGGLLPLEETITAYEPHERIEYRITKGSPLKGHRGEMRFTERPDGGTNLRYEITFGGKLPGADRIVASGLRRSIPKGLDKAAERA